MFDSSCVKYKKVSMNNKKITDLFQWNFYAFVRFVFLCEQCICLFVFLRCKPFDSIGLESLQETIAWSKSHHMPIAHVTFSIVKLYNIAVTSSISHCLVVHFYFKTAISTARREMKEQRRSNDWANICNKHGRTHTANTKPINKNAFCAKSAAWLLLCVCAVPCTTIGDFFEKSLKLVWLLFVRCALYCYEMIEKDLYRNIFYYRNVCIQWKNQTYLFVLLVEHVYLHFVYKIFYLWLCLGIQLAGFRIKMGHLDKTILMTD